MDPDSRHKCRQLVMRGAVQDARECNLGRRQAGATWLLSQLQACTASGADQVQICMQRAGRTILSPPGMRRARRQLPYSARVCSAAQGKHTPVWGFAQCSESYGTCFAGTHVTGSHVYRLHHRTNIAHLVVCVWPAIAEHNGVYCIPSRGPAALATGVQLLQHGNEPAFARWLLPHGVEGMAHAPGQHVGLHMAGDMPLMHHAGQQRFHTWCFAAPAPWAGGDSHV